MEGNHKWKFTCRAAMPNGNKVTMEGGGKSVQRVITGIGDVVLERRFNYPDEIHIFSENAESVTTLAIRRIIAEYQREHGSDGVVDSAKAEVKRLEEIFGSRLGRVRKVCHAAKGISCDYALASGGYDVCSAKHDCPFRREEVR